jgi:hypothetical protein
MKLECEHCGNRNCFIEEKVSDNPYIVEFRCFYCGWATWEER